MTCLDPQCATAHHPQKTHMAKGKEHLRGWSRAGGAGSTELKTARNQDLLERCFLRARKEKIMAGFTVMCSMESAIHHTDVSKRVPIIRDLILELHAHPVSDRAFIQPSLSSTPTEHTIFLHLWLPTRRACWKLLASSQKSHRNGCFSVLHEIGGWWMPKARSGGCMTLTSPSVSPVLQNWTGFSLETSQQQSNLWPLH